MHGPGLPGHALFGVWPARRPRFSCRRARIVTHATLARNPMSDPSLSERSRYWSRYWAGGALTSLPQDFAGNYDGEIAEFWQRQCQSLPDGSNILDVCTGNGAVALLIANCARQSGRTWSITGMDAAEVDADRAVDRHRDQALLLEHIRFIDGQPFETLQAEPDSFDLIVSQYGIEYCDWAAAAGQVARLLKPGGRMAMINHAPDSDMLSTMRAEARDYQRLDRLKLLPAIDAWLAQRMDSDRLAGHLQSTRQKIRQSPGRRTSPLFRYVLEMIDGMRRAGPAAFGQYRAPVREFHDQLVAGRGRLMDMLRVNEAMIADPGWTRVFEQAGLVSLESGELSYRQQHRVGRFHSFEKRAT